MEPEVEGRKSGFKISPENRKMQCLLRLRAWWWEKGGGAEKINNNEETNFSEYYLKIPEFEKSPIDFWRY